MQTKKYIDEVGTRAIIDHLVVSNTAVTNLANAVTARIQNQRIKIIDRCDTSNTKTMESVMSDDIAALRSADQSININNIMYCELLA